MEVNRIKNEEKKAEQTQNKSTKSYASIETKKWNWIVRGKLYLANKQIAIACRMQHAYNQKIAGKMKPRKKNEFWDQT